LKTRGDQADLRQAIKHIAREIVDPGAVMGDEHGRMRARAIGARERDRHRARAHVQHRFAREYVHYRDSLSC